MRQLTTVSNDHKINTNFNDRKIKTSRKTTFFPAHR
jgi:hypothetical protein